MTTTPSRLDSAQKITSKSLLDIIGWLKEGDYVVIHNAFTVGRYFHKCMGDAQDEGKIATILENTRVDYVNVSTLPNLLDEGEWECHFKQEGFNECTCSLKGRVSSYSDIPHAHFLKINLK